MKKIILFYIFRPLSDPEAIKLWQLNSAQLNHLKGRILISKHGINGILGGEEKDLKNYIKNNKTYSLFKDIHYKWSFGIDNDFPRLSVKVRQEIVTFGLEEDELQVDNSGIVGGGQHISPQKVHELVEAKKNDIVFFDGRNYYEAKTGHFKNAILPKVNYTREFKDEIKKPIYNNLKDKTIITYCTGGIRCEVLTFLMKRNGFKHVYQIEGGIENYGRVYGDNGLWIGSMYTFDGRMGYKFSSQAKDIAKCHICQAKTSHYDNCANKKCNKLMIICQKCSLNQAFCSKKCREEINLQLS